MLFRSVGDISMFERVGLIGVGAMGQALLHRLRLSHVAVQAYDIAPACLEKAREMGATPVASAAAAAKDGTPGVTV